MLNYRPLRAQNLSRRGPEPAKTVRFCRLLRVGAGRKRLASKRKARCSAWSSVRTALLESWQIGTSGLACVDRLQSSVWDLDSASQSVESIYGLGTQLMDTPIAGCADPCHQSGPSAPAATGSRAHGRVEPPHLSSGSDLSAAGPASHTLFGFARFPERLGGAFDES